MTTLILFLRQHFIFPTKSLDNYEWLNFCVTRHDFIFIVKVSRMKLACKIDFAATAQWDQITKIRQKLDEKIRQNLTDRTYACSSLANFEYEHIK